MLFVSELKFGCSIGLWAPPGHRGHRTRPDRTGNQGFNELDFARADLVSLPQEPPTFSPGSPHEDGVLIPLKGLNPCETMRWLRGGSPLDSLEAYPTTEKSICDKGFLFGNLGGGVQSRFAGSLFGSGTISGKEGESEEMPAR